MDTLLLNADGNPISLLPLSTLNWQTAIRLMFLDKVVPIKFYDDWVVRSPTKEMNVPSVVMTKKYVKSPKFVPFTRQNVYLRDEFTCQLQITSVCARSHGKGHSTDDLTLDHVHPKSFGGKQSWNNIITACAECNSHKGNRVIIPKTTARMPTYYDLAEKRKKTPLFIADKAWMDYLGWDESLVYLKPRKNLT